VSSLANPSIRVISNVARDILQSAGVFKTLPVVVWEYVSNSLQYVDQNVTPKVVVRINTAKRIATISDNGAGMDFAGLQNYFTMHGHNQQRLAGKAGRGTFGTGKSAAFGIAEKLAVRTVRNGLRNTVTLARADIDREAQKGNVTEVPVETIEHNLESSEPNGTVITIEDITAKCDVRATIAFVQRHIGRGFKNAEVIINDHEVEYDEPAFTEVCVFSPGAEQRAVLGDVALMVRVSQAPLEEGRKGVDITSCGVLFETTLGSVEGKEMSQYLFGELEVPQLINQSSGPNPAFNMTRDMKLNLENTLVEAIHTFISTKLDEVRRRLVEAEKQRQRSEEAKRLQRQADGIAKLLNDDFIDYSDKIARIRATVSGLSRDEAPEKKLQPGDAESFVLFGGDEDVEVIAETGGPGGSPTGEGGGGGNTERAQNPLVKPKENGDPLGERVRGKQSKAPARGGFRVEYRPLGRDEYRATYDRETRTIVINLDFPQVAAAMASDGTESVTFQRLSNEVAITEYAIAVSRELVYSTQYSDPSDYIFEIRQTINRISRKSAEVAA